MKIIYILLIFSIFQSILNETTISIEVMEEAATPLECDETGVYYGFAFNALISGIEKETELKFYLGSPNYAYTSCWVPVAEDGKTQTINCIINSQLFPLYEDQLTIQLPPKADNELNIPIINWDKMLKLTPKITFQKACYFSYKYEIVPSNLKLYCEKEENDEVTKTLIGETSCKAQSGSLPDDFTYIFQAYALIDGDYAQMNCMVFDASEENSSDYYLNCNIPGEKKAILFPTTGMSSLTSELSKFNIKRREISLDCNGSNYLSSAFSKFAFLLILSLILF